MCLRLAHQPNSIVAVHGLGGDSYGTWTDSSSQEFWLRTFLPKDLPTARVMTFGYNANILRKKARGEIYSFAEELLAALRRNRTGTAVSSARRDNVYALLI
jgi:hypothetical protein